MPTFNIASRPSAESAKCWSRTLIQLRRFVPPADARHVQAEALPDWHSVRYLGTLVPGGERL